MGVMCRLDIRDGEIYDFKYPYAHYDRERVEHYFKCGTCRDYVRCDILNLLDYGTTIRENLGSDKSSPSEQIKNDGEV